MAIDNNSVWKEVKDRLRNDGISPTAFTNFINPLVPYKTEGDYFILLANNEYIVPIVEMRYLEKIKNALKAVTSVTFNVKIVLDTEVGNLNISENTNKESVFSRSNLRSKYVFESFVKGKSNEFAFAAAQAVSESPGKTSYNPLFLYGDVGLGKTHLMHSIGNYILEKDPDSKVLYTSSENLMNDFITSIKEHKNQEFRDKYRKIDVLLIDDIQFLLDKEGTQEEFFHTFNTLYNNNKQIVISSDRPPHELKTLEQRLRSRFGSGLTVDITLPDFETRTAILEKKIEQENIVMPVAVIRYIAKSISSNIRELEGALNKVTGFAKLTNTEITLELAEKALKDIVGDGVKREITVDFIQEIVGNYYDLSPDEIRSKKRKANIVAARHVAMYLSRMLINSPLIQIGKCFGGKDHTTVIHACNKISEDLETNEDLKREIYEIERKIKGE